LSGAGAELVERNIAITPTGDGLTNAAFAFDGSVLLRPGDGRERSDGGAGENGLENSAAR